MITSTLNRIRRALSPTAPGARMLAAAIIAGAAITACDVHGTSGTTSPGTVSTIVVTPNGTIGTSATLQMIAVGKDASGNVVTITPVWSVAALGGTISTSGMFTSGTTAGVYTNTVVATVGTITGSASITVTPGAIATIVVSPTPSTLAQGATQQFTAVAKDANSNVVTFTPTWTIVAAGGTMNSTGLFTAGVTAGTFTNTVMAASGAISGTASVVVTAGAIATIAVTPTPATMTISGTQQFAAVAKDAGGNVVAFTPTWSIVAAGGTINSTGLFTAGTLAGTFTGTVKAASGAISGVATAVVTAGPIATIALTPNPATVSSTTTQQFVATAKDAGGNTVLPFAPTWSVVASGGTVDVNGLFTAGATLGTFTNTVKAASGAISGFATVNVTVNLAAAAPNGIMAGTAVTCITGGTINADVSVSPGNTVTGFGPCVITGVQHLGDAVALQGQTDLTAAYNTLAGLPCPPANAIVANLGGTTKTAGVYCTASGIGVTGVLTLDGGGDPNATFVFQAGTSLTTAGNVVMINSAQAKNVYWVIGSSATLGVSSLWQGNILAVQSITLVDNATLLGRALARNGAVSLGTNNTITLP